MGRLNGFPHGQNIKKANLNVITVEKMIGRFNFNGEHTLADILKPFDVHYIPILYKFGYFAAYGTIHYSTAIPGHKDLYLKYIDKDDKFFYNRKRHN